MSHTDVRPLPVPESPIKSDGTYRATLWLRNPGPNRRLHNQPCRVLMILDHDGDPSRALYASIDRFSFISSGPPGILDFPSLAAILSFIYSDIRDYLIFICDYIRYIFYSTPLDSSILIVVPLTELVLARFCSSSGLEKGFMVFFDFFPCKKKLRKNTRVSCNQISLLISKKRQNVL